MSVNKKQNTQALKNNKIKGIAATYMVSDALKKAVERKQNKAKEKGKKMTSKPMRSSTKPQDSGEGTTGGIQKKATGITKTAGEITGMSGAGSNEIRFSPWYVIDQFLTLQLMFIIAIILIMGIFLISGDLRVYMVPIGMVLICTFLVIDLIWSFLTIYQGRNSFYSLDNAAITYNNNGLFFKRKVRYPIDGRTQFTLRQGIRGMLLHFGTIRVTGLAAASPLRLRRIANPNDSLTKLQQLVNQQK